MKTRDRILVTSLALFNEEGEAHTTTIDIANELDISPGHLYYHFKGNDQLIAELYHQYEVAIPGTYYLYVVLEEMYQYRFLYHNLDDILQRYPAIEKRFRQLIQLKRAALFAICQRLIEESVIETEEQQLVSLVDNMTLVLNYWLNYARLLHGEREPQLIIHQGVLQLLTMVAPYLGEDQITFYHDCESIYADMLERY